MTRSPTTSSRRCSTLYRTTVDKFSWGHQYLNAALFDLLRRRWKHRLAFVVARRRGAILAGTFNVQKGDVLYGRYWGTFEDVRHLHFNVCYYAAIELCLQHGHHPLRARRRRRVQAPPRLRRARDARACTSSATRGFADAVRRYLVEERRAVAREIGWLDTQTAMRRDAAG